jgi:hypothetical protein
MKEEDVECEKRCASTEKHKSLQDADKKKEKRKNLERQALESIELRRGVRGSLRRTQLMRMTMMMTTTTPATPRGWQLSSIGPCKAYRRLSSLRRVRGPRKGRKVETMTGAKRRRLLTARVDTPPASTQGQVALLP